MNVFGLDADILNSPAADYHWRTFIDRGAFKVLVNALIDGLDYTNFKNANDEDLHELYAEFWGMRRAYGTNDPALRTENRARKRGRTTDRTSHLAWGPGDLEHHPKS